MEQLKAKHESFCEDSRKNIHQLTHERTEAITNAGASELALEQSMAECDKLRKVNSKLTASEKRIKQDLKQNKIERADEARTSRHELFQVTEERDKAVDDMEKAVEDLKKVNARADNLLYDRNKWRDSYAEQSLQQVPPGALQASQKDCNRLWLGRNNLRDEVSHSQLISALH